MTGRHHRSILGRNAPAWAGTFQFKSWWCMEVFNAVFSVMLLVLSGWMVYLSYRASKEQNLEFALLGWIGVGVTLLASVVIWVTGR